MACKRGPFGSIITVQDEYKPGDPPPDGYLAWHEWADVQRKAGIKQKQCVSCGKWRVPVELSGKKRTYQFQTAKGIVSKTGPTCLDCETTDSDG